VGEKRLRASSPSSQSFMDASLRIVR